jgi:hypothetical protein
MSAAPDAHTPNAHDDHAHAFDGEPVKVLPPDEPRTPGYIPLLGVALFVVAGVALLLTSDGDSTTAATTEKTGEQARQAPAVNPPAAPAAQALPGSPQPGGAPTVPAVSRLNPEQAKALQQRIEEARARQQAGQPGAQPAPNPAGRPQPIQPQPIQPQPRRPAPPPAPAGDMVQ